MCKVTFFSQTHHFPIYSVTDYCFWFESSQEIIHMSHRPITFNIFLCKSLGHEQILFPQDNNFLKIVCDNRSSFLYFFSVTSLTLGVNVGGKEYMRKIPIYFKDSLYHSLNKYPLANASPLHGFRPQPIQKLRKKKAHT